MVVRSGYSVEKMKRKPDFMVQDGGSENLLAAPGAQEVNLNGRTALNDTAACARGLLAEERSKDAITVAVVERFDVVAEVGRACVQPFVDETA